MINNFVAVKALCIDAERQFNTLVTWYSDLPYNDASERQIDRMREILNSTYADLRGANIGGVLINGVFRNLNP